MAAQSEPPHIKTLLDRLRKLAAGLSLCGAGAGGFGVLILRHDVTSQVFFDLIRQVNADTGAQLSAHRVSVDEDGLIACVCEDTGASLNHFLQL